MEGSDYTWILYMRKAPSAGVSSGALRAPCKVYLASNVRDSHICKFAIT